jgi:multidrug efflux pump subunit AcrA (membrane-fusion protein)
MVVPSASPDTRYRGTIEAVLPVVDTATRAGRVLVRVRTADGQLRPGMYADVQLEAARREVATLRLVAGPGNRH